MIVPAYAASEIRGCPVKCAPAVPLNAPAAVPLNAPKQMEANRMAFAPVPLIAPSCQSISEPLPAVLNDDRILAFLARE